MSQELEAFLKEELTLALQHLDYSHQKVLKLSANPMERVDDELKNAARLKDLEILAEIKSKKEIGDRRIDLKVISNSDLKNDPFIKEISQTWIELEK